MTGDDNVDNPIVQILREKFKRSCMAVSVNYEKDKNGHKISFVFKDGSHNPINVGWTDKTDCTSEQIAEKAFSVVAQHYHE